MNTKRIALIIASILVSIITLVLVLQDAPLTDVFETIQTADKGMLIIVFIILTLSLFTRGIRWWGLLGYRLPIVQACNIVNVMFLGNQLPFRMGEVARSILSIRGGVPIITSATSIVVERLVDMLVVVVMIAGVVSQLPNVPDYVTQTSASLGTLAIIGFVSALIFARLPKLAHRILDTVLNILPILKKLPLKTMLDHVLDGLQPLTNIRTLAFVLFWTVIAWSMSLASFYFLHLALGIEVTYTLSVPLGIALASLSVALPVSVAAVGPFEAAIVLTGTIMSMDSVDAVSLGFLLHGMSVLAYAVWGVVGLLALGISPTTAFKPKPTDAVDT
jgi:uncharacterized membrane protein YbhN (UPF0104 family)